MRARAEDVVGSIFLDEEPKKPAVGVVVAVADAKEDAELARNGNGDRTDANGQFRVTNVPLGAHYIAVNREGFGKWGEKQQFSNYLLPESKAITLEAGKAVRVDFALSRGASIVGRALDTDGKPITQLFIAATPAAKLAGDAEQDGRFEITGVPPGVDERIYISPNHIPRFLFSIYKDIPGQQLKAGGTVNVGDLTFKPLTGKPNFKGTIFDSAGNPITGIAVFDAVHLTMPISAVLVVREGQFEQELPPGKYKIIVPDHVPERFVANVEVEEGKLTELKLTMPPAAK